MSNPSDHSFCATDPHDGQYEKPRALPEGASKLADELGEVAGRCSSERDRETIIMACNALRAARLAATKTIYVKPLRTLVAVDERYADQIRDLLNAASRPMPGREPVAWRWRNSGSTEWVYQASVPINKHPDRLEIEPLFTQSGEIDK